VFSRPVSAGAGWALPWQLATKRLAWAGVRSRRVLAAGRGLGKRVRRKAGAPRKPAAGRPWPRSLPLAAFRPCRRKAVPARRSSTCHSAEGARIRKAVPARSTRVICASRRPSRRRGRRRKRDSRDAGTPTGGRPGPRPLPGAQPPPRAEMLGQLARPPPAAHQAKAKANHAGRRKPRSSPPAFTARLPPAGNRWLGGPG
jgi:hypothetical protein